MKKYIVSILFASLCVMPYMHAVSKDAEIAKYMRAVCVCDGIVNGLLMFGGIGSLIYCCAKDGRLKRAFEIAAKDLEVLMTLHAKKESGALSEDEQKIEAEAMQRRQAFVAAYKIKDLRLDNYTQILRAKRKRLRVGKWLSVVTAMLGVMICCGTLCNCCCGIGCREGLISELKNLSRVLGISSESCSESMDLS